MVFDIYYFIISDSYVLAKELRVTFMDDASTL